MPIVNKGVLDSKDIFERLVGNDWPTSQIIFTNDVSESSSNLYYTNTRVQAYLDVQGYSTGGGGGGLSGIDLSGNTTTDLAEGDNLYYSNNRVLAYLNFTGYVAGEFSNIAGNTTSDLAEGNNLYYTNARVEAYVGTLDYLDSGNTTTDLAEGDNLYYTNARVLAHLAESNVAVKSISTTEAGTPTISSATSINLVANSSAGGAVVIQNSALRIKSYTTTDRADLTPSTGDIIYNTTDQSLQVYKGSSWSNVGSLSSLIDFTTDDLAEGSNLYYTNARVLSGVTPKLTTANVSELTNLYYTNTRVQAYLDDNNISGGGGDLSGNTTTDLAEGTNLYYTNARAKTAYTAGAGILINNGTISADVNIPAEQSFDVTIDNTVLSILTNNMEDTFSVSSTSTYRHLLKSLVLTNIGENTATVNANVVYSSTEYELANSLQIPYGFSADLRFNPEVLMPGTTYKLQADSNNKISVFATYKTVEDISFVSDINSLTPDSYTTIYDANDADTIIESIKISNHEGTNLRGTLQVRNLSDDVVSYVAANTLLAANYPSELLENPIRLPLGYKLSFVIFSGRGTSIVSGRKSEAYTITSNVETISEGESVTFTIATVNISDGATRYFRTSGNVSADDFTTGNTGSFTVLNDSATVTLTANLDQSAGNDEIGEQFQLVLAKSSTTGSSVATSNVISIIDTSNSVGVSSLTVSSNLIYETEAIILTIDTINAAGNAGGTLYYTITGNADIYSSTSGDIIINDNTANLEIIAEASITGDEVRQFAVQIRSGSVSGTILETTDTVYVKDSIYKPSELSLAATGGNQILDIEI